MLLHEGAEEVIQFFFRLALIFVNPLLHHNHPLKAEDMKL